MASTTQPFVQRTLEVTLAGFLVGVGGLSAACSAPPDADGPAASLWTNGADNRSWDDPDNWERRILPGVARDADFRSSTPAIVDIQPGVTNSALDLEIHDGSHVFEFRSGSSIEIADEVEIGDSGPASLTLRGPGTLVGHAVQFTVGHKGSVDNVGTLRVAGGATIDWSNGFVRVGRGLEDLPIPGHLEVVAGGKMVLNGSSLQVGLNGPGTLELSGSRSMISLGGDPDSGTGDLLIGTAASGSVVVEEQAVLSGIGELVVGNGSSASLSVLSGGSVRVTGPRIAVNGGQVAVSGGGSILAGAGTGTALSIEAGGSLSLAAGGVVQGIGSLSFDSEARFNLSFEAGPAGDVTVSGAVSLNGARIVVTGAGVSGEAYPVLRTQGDDVISGRFNEEDLAPGWSIEYRDSQVLLHFESAAT